MRHEPPRVALLLPYWEFWGASARGDLHAELTQAGIDVARALIGVNVVTQEILRPADDAGSVARRVRESASEVVLVAQTMAVAPAGTMRVLDALDDLPLVVWAMNRRPSASGSFDHSDITTEGATVGTSQLVNLIVRRRRPLALEVGQLQDPSTVERVSSSIAAAAAARRLSRARLARVGHEPDGYDCVVCDFDALSSALGLTVTDVDPRELVQAFEAVTPEALERVTAEVADEFWLAPSLTLVDDGLGRSLRFAAALEQLDARHQIDAGAINCHIGELRYSPAIGIAPCFALGRETSNGIPWCCAGDVLTAVAMLTTRLLGGGALYHELERIDYLTDELVLANTGEHDLALRGLDEPPQLRSNGWFASDPVCGVCACFPIPAGAATLVAFTPHPDEPSGFRFVVAEGEFTGRSLPQTGTPNGGFRFCSGSASDGYRAWALAGANHHSSASAGHLGAGVAQLAMHLGVGAVNVSPATARD
jgi:L-arabinose isomerase